MVKFFWEWLFALVMVLLIVIALPPVLRWRTRIAEEQLQQELLQHGQMIAETINLNSAHFVAESPHDSEQLRLRRLRQQMDDYSRLLKHQQIWMVTTDPHNALVHHYPCPDLGRSMDKSGFFPPDEEIKAVFQHGQPVVSGPFGPGSDPLYTAMAPISDPQTGSVLMVVGLNHASREWLSELNREKRMAIFFALGLTAIAVLAAAGMHLRRGSGRPAGSLILRDIEVMAVLAFGLWGTLVAAVVLHDHERRHRYQNYQHLVYTEARLLTQSLLGLRDHKLDSLVRFHHNSETVTKERFHAYTAPLLRRQALHAIGWVKPVPAATRADHQQQLKEQVLAGAEIWEFDADGQRRPAADRQVLYPVWYVEPLEAMAQVTGFDLGSEAVRRAAVERAIAEGMSVATDPLPLLPLDFSGEARGGMLILHPVYRDPGAAATLEGLVLLAVDWERFLSSIRFSSHLHCRPTTTYIYQLEQGRIDKLIVDTGQGENRNDPANVAGKVICHCSHRLKSVFPVFAFGRSYVMLIQAEQAFLAANPLHQWRLAALAGSLLTLTLTIGAGQAMRRRRNLEREVQARNEELSATLYSIGDAVIATDHHSRVQRLNPIAADLTGWSEQEARGRPLDEVFVIINENTRRPVPDPVSQALRKGTVVGLANHTMLIARDGRERPIADSAAPIRGTDGGIIGVVLVFRDQTEERQNESDLRESEAMTRYSNAILKAIREINQLIVREKDKEKMLVRACETLVRHPDYSAALILLVDRQNRQRPWFHASAGMSNGFKPLLSLIQEGKLPPCCKETSKSNQVSVYTGREKEIICRDCPALEECLQATTLCILLDDENETLGYMTVHLQQPHVPGAEELQLFAELGDDISYALHAIETDDQNRALQEQLLQAQKMEAVGRLAGGVAHDFNNMLAIIMGNAELAMLDLENDKQVYEELQTIASTAARSAELTQQLLAFARKQIVAPQVLELNETIENMLKMMKRLIGENINLSWRPCRTPIRIKIDPVQLNQILANLLVNSRDAIQNTGDIIIETKTADFPESYPGTHAEIQPGRYAVLVISDDGTGMDREIIAHIFEPFFSTKKGGHGTGLGLSTVYGVVNQNQGFINVYSEPAYGTTFKIYLPLEDTNEDDQVLEIQEKGTGYVGNETVLMVEDEKTLLQLGEKMLLQMGYKVLTADNPQKALEISSEYRQEIHLLLTDVILPDMNGRELWEKLTRQRPRIKSLFISGYTANVIAHQGILDKDIDFLEKPFTKQTLGEKVREVLDR